MSKPLLHRVASRRIGVVLALTLGVWLSLPALPQELQTRPVEPAGEGIVSASLDSIVAAAMAAGPYAGMVVMVERRNQLVHARGYGYADLENRVVMTPEAVFQIGSITKSFTGLAVMQLVEQRQLSLSAPIADYLPDYPAPGREIAIRHLLNHTSGIPNYTSEPDYPPSPQSPLTAQQVLGYFAGRPLLFAAGEQFAYSNSNTFLLGLIVEKASGLSYAEYVRQHILEPFGMTHSSVADYARIMTGRARGYLPAEDGFENAPLYHPTASFSAGAMMSTGADLLRYRREVFAGPQVSTSLRALLTSTSRLNDGTPVYYADGCLIVSTFEGHRKYSHSGEIDGFSAHYAYYPDDDVTIVVLTNTGDTTVPPVSIEHKLARAVLGIPAPPVTDLDVSAAELERFAGDYLTRPFRFGPDRYGFVGSDGRLALQFGGIGRGGPTIPLRYLGNGRFVSGLDDEMLIQFGRNGAGRRAGFEMSYYDGRFVGVPVAD